MGFISKVTVRNFRCFRRPTELDLGQSTYLVGINNSGKTALLSALHCFFNSNAFIPEYLNKTELLSKQEGYNRSDISITFDLNLVSGPVRKRRMTDAFGETLEVRKSFTFREVSKSIVEEYTISGENFSFDGLDDDVQAVLNSVSISYIHPQEGQQLLEKAQEKFKNRLFNNWGRHASVSERLRELQQQWDDLRQTANTYLSSTLTANLRRIWPSSSTKVDLPARIEDIVAVSDIAFRSSPSLPEVTLTSQGTGAQSTILYQTHYILDSDRSLHRGMYFPMWLLEEPESFLHADIAVQLAKLLNSSEWLANIQMVISTHSPIILAASRQTPERTRWVVFQSHAVELQKSVLEVTDGDIMSVGEMMGDSNFDAYFSASADETRVFLEDSRRLTKDKLVDAGIPVTFGLNGISQVKKYLAVYSSLPEAVNGKVFFLIDNDLGTRELRQYLHRRRDRHEDGFARYPVSDNVFIVLMPSGFRSEDLFDEFDDILEECCDSIYDDQLNFRDQVPLNLTRAVSALRRKERPGNREEAKALIRNEQDVKDMFWERVQQSEYSVADGYRTLLRAIMDLEEAEQD